MWQIITYVKCLCIFSNLKMHQVGWMEPPNGLVLTRRPFVWQPLFRRMCSFISGRMLGPITVCVCVWKGCTHPCGTAGFYRNIWYLSQHALMGILHRCVLPRSAHPSGSAQTFSQSWCRTSGRPCRCLKQRVGLARVPAWCRNVLDKSPITCEGFLDFNQERGGKVSIDVTGLGLRRGRSEWWPQNLDHTKPTIKTQIMDKWHIRLTLWTHALICSGCLCCWRFRDNCSLFIFTFSSSCLSL